jgi:hypothetical protein
MNRQYGESKYWSSFVDGNREGFARLELYRERDAEVSRVAAVTYWDACGQYFVETFGTDVELVVMEQLIDEAKAAIKVS